MFAAGIVVLTAVGFSTAERKITATAPAVAPVFATCVKNVAGSSAPEVFTSPMRPLAVIGQSAGVWPFFTNT